MEQGQFLTPRPVKRAWGEVKRFEEPAPAEGTTWKFKFPAGFVWRLVSIRVVLTAAAEAGERILGARILDPKGVNYYEIVAPTAVKTGETANLTLATTSGESSAGTPQVKTVAMPEFIYWPEWEIEGVTQAIAAKDKFGKLAVLLEGFEIEPRPSLQLRDAQHRHLADLVELLHDSLA